MNRWGIPPKLEVKIRKQGKRCVYCGIKMKNYPHARGVRKDKATVEHINNNGGASETNIAMCCGACNSSKGTKTLLEWFQTEYCKKNEINEKTVSHVVKNWIKRRGREGS